MGAFVRTIIVLLLIMGIASEISFADSPQLLLQNGHQSLTADFRAESSVGTAAPVSVQFTDTSLGTPDEWYWDFGDGTHDSGQNPLHTYTNPGIYSVSLSVTGQSGSDMKTRLGYISVSTPKVTLPTLSPLKMLTTPEQTTIPTETLTIPLTPTPDQTPIPSLTETPAPISTPTEQPSREVTPLPTLIPTIDRSETDLLNLFNTQVHADFYPSVTAGLGPLLVQFTDNSTGSPTGWVWDFGDGTSSDVSSPEHTYMNPGTYSVRLTVQGQSGSDTKASEHLIEVTQHPVVSLRAQPRSGSAPLTVAFTDNSTGRITSRVWSFGDGTSSDEANPLHTYARAGVYDVSLTVSGPDGGADTLSPALITVTDLIQPPVAAISVDTSGGVTPLSVRFTDVSTGDVTTRTWDFGDGVTAADSDLTHTYQKSGSYTTTLTIKGPAGESRTEKSITVLEPVLQPKAGFISDSTSGIAPLTVRFTDSSSGTVSSWKWDFGDGMSSGEKNPTHIFSSAGSFPVILTVSGPAGENQTTKTIVVTESASIPSVSFSTTPSEGYASLSVSFADFSSGSISSWKWDFGDGTSSPDQNPTHTLLFCRFLPRGSEGDGSRW